LVIVTSDASIKNNVTTSISHIHSCSSPIKKTLHHAINVTMTEAELFAIKCGISQVIQVPDIFCIIIIMNSIHVALFISINHSQLLSSRSSDYFSTNNPIIPLSSGIVLAKISDGFIYWLIMTQKSSTSLLYIPAKHHGTLYKKEECNSYIKNWQILFLTSNLKEKHFLDLLDDKHNTIVPSYVKGGP